MKTTVYNIDVIDARNGSTVRTVTLDLRKNTIGYCLDRRSGCFIVTLSKAHKPGSRPQQIAVLPAFFRKVTGINPKSIANVISVTDAQLNQLGFKEVTAV